MRGALKRNATIFQLLQTHQTKITDPVTRIHPQILRNQTQSRDFFNLTNFLRKSTNGISPCMFSAAFYSSNSSTTSVSKLRFVGWYLGMIKSRPVLTKSITTSLIYVAADLSSQTIASSQPYDIVRTLRMGGFGMIVSGPTLHLWFNLVSKVLPKRDLITTLKKTVMGMTLYDPFMIVVFLSLNASMQGENGEEIVARLKRDLLPTMIRGVTYWPICDFITFKFIPVHLQPLVSNSFSYLWTIYMTYMASLEKAAIVPN